MSQRRTFYLHEDPKLGISVHDTSAVAWDRYDRYGGEYTRAVEIPADQPYSTEEFLRRAMTGSDMLIASTLPARVKAWLAGDYATATDGLPI